jgi:hypothetical protein
LYDRFFTMNKGNYSIPRLQQTCSLRRKSHVG